MVTYRNVETGKTDSYTEPVRLLERSPRWERVEDKPPPTPKAPKPKAPKPRVPKPRVPKPPPDL